MAILGAGSMGAAVARAIAAAGVARSLTVTNRTRAKADALAQIPGVRSLATDEDHDANGAAAAAADVVVLGVKPDAIAGLVSDIGARLRPGTVLVSIAAGIPTAAIERSAPPGTAVVRAMPNTPAALGQGVTGLAAGSSADAADVAAVRGVFAACGAVVEVAEDRIDALSTISGSGPAYVFLLVEALTAAARDKGFPPEQARVLAEQTFIGAAALLAETGADPADLRRGVTSPGGTTERAISVLAAADLAGLFARATDAALARARELAADS